ncbi:MAG: CBS domain-containing protein, partial [Verrucomicrobiaceae bacterium]
PEMLVREVLQEMTQRRSGAAVAVDEDRRLAGIFTHGDFARYFPSTPGIGGMPVAQFLTRKPITVRADRLAVEVLHLVEKHRIDDLVVVDEDERPVGMVDSQDLARLRLV